MVFSGFKSSDRVVGNYINVVLKFFVSSESAIQQFSAVVSFVVGALRSVAFREVRCQLIDHRCPLFFLGKARAFQSLINKSTFCISLLFAME